MNVMLVFGTCATVEPTTIGKDPAYRLCAQTEYATGRLIAEFEQFGIHLAPTADGALLIPLHVLVDKSDSRAINTIRENLAKYARGPESPPRP